MASTSIYFRQLGCRESHLTGTKQARRLDRFSPAPSVRQQRKLVAPAHRVAQRSDDTLVAESSSTVATLSPVSTAQSTDAQQRSPTHTDKETRASVPKAKRDLKRTKAEHERELQESLEDPSCSGRMGQVMFYGAAGRVGNYCHLGIGRRHLFRRDRLDYIRVELEEAERTNTILVGKRRQMLAAKSVRGPESRRSDHTTPGPSQDGPGPQPTPHSRKNKKALVLQQQSQDPDAPPAPRPRRNSQRSRTVQPGEEVGNVVAHNFDLSGSSIKRIMKPGFALSVAPGVILPILPNIMAINGPLGIKEMEEMASQRVLSSVLTLEVPKELCSISLDGDTRKFRRSIQFKAAALSRLVVRAQQRHSPSYVILLQCWNPTMQPVAQLIAAWLHWHYHMGIEEACARAGAACGCYVPCGLLDEANEDLYTSAKIRANRGRLVWPHGAYLARVAGDVVGSWCPSDMKLVSRRDKELYGLREGDWVLQLPTLEPGHYRYKYVVDEHWRVDWRQPHRLDEHSNWNNIWEVPPNLPEIEYTPEQKLEVIRKEFMSLALRVKMKLEPKLLAK